MNTAQNTIVHRKMDGKRFRFGVLIALSTLLLGCLRTDLAPTSPNQSTLTLAAGSNKLIGLKSESFEESPTLGHQFLFVVIPFGRIVFNSPNLLVQNIAFEELALRGYAPSSGSGVTLPRTLKISLQKLDLSAYDLIAFRRVVCTVQLVMTYEREGFGMRETLVTKKESEYRVFAFRTHLDFLLEKTAREAITQALRELRI